MTRREWFLASAAPLAARPDSGWTREMDQALLAAALKQADATFDAARAMVQRKLDTAYRIHTTLRGVTAHPTRESLHYALLLLEGGRRERAAQVIEAVLAAQDTDPASKTFGLWGYYLEEPPAKMSPPDFNWADFNGATLCLILHRHSGRLPGSLAKQVCASLDRACESIRRRNVSMGYTNIAVQGTFVTLAAAELLASAQWQAYALERLGRLWAEHEKSGSFAEFNSPTYMRVTITNLTRLRMVVRNAQALERAAQLEDRAWLHVVRHWHPPTRQLAGPMSRCYSTWIGRPLWIQKATGNRVQFVPPERIAEGEGADETAIHDYRCPERFLPMWRKLEQAREHRELFIAGAAPVTGTTWLEPRFSLGTANRLDFWEQRRPLLAYWGTAEEPRYLRLRFLKDDHDFSSALFFGVQQRGLAIGAVTFRSPGGDRHPSLDAIQEGRFRARLLELRLEFSHEGEGPVRFAVAGGRFGEREVKTTVLHSSAEPVEIAWGDVKEAFLAFAVGVHTAPPKMRLVREGEIYRFTAGPLAMTFSPRVQTVAAHQAAFQEWVEGRPAPVVRLG
jgi:hypothetical protein